MAVKLPSPSNDSYREEKNNTDKRNEKQEVGCLFFFEMEKLRRKKSIEKERHQNERENKMDIHTNRALSWTPKPAWMV